MPHPDKQMQPDIAQLKKKLSLPIYAHLPKCPGKSRVRAKALDKELGKEFHIKSNHFCNDCACRNSAGYKTGHYGYGLCKWHEGRMSDNRKEEVAEKHLTAIRQRNPFDYRHAETWLHSVGRDAEKAQVQIDFTGELNIARGLIQEMIAKSSGDEEGKVQLEAKIDTFSEMLVDQALDPKDIADVLKELKKITKLLQRPIGLTELANGKEVEMSDKTRMELQLKLLRGYTAMGVDHFAVNKHEVIPIPEHNRWLKGLVDVCGRFVPEQAWPNFVMAIKQIGEPKRA